MNYLINRNVLFLHLLTADDSRPDLSGVHVNAGKAIGSDGTILGSVECSGDWTGFLPTDACKAVLNGAKRHHRFQVEQTDENTFYLTRCDGVSFKVKDARYDPSRAPDFESVMGKEPTNALDCPVGIDLSLLTRIQSYLKKVRVNEDLPLGTSFSFSEPLSPIMIECGPFKGLVMPCRL